MTPTHNMYGIVQLLNGELAAGSIGFDEHTLTVYTRPVTKFAEPPDPLQIHPIYFRPAMRLYFPYAQIDNVLLATEDETEAVNRTLRWQPKSLTWMQRTIAQLDGSFIPSTAPTPTAQPKESDQ